MARIPLPPQALPFLALLLFVFAPVASAQSGGTGVGPVDDTYAYVTYTVNNTVNPPPSNGTGNNTGNSTTPGNGTTPSGNGTTPSGNGTTPPANGTNPPANGTNPPGGGTNPPDGTEPTDDGTDDPGGDDAAGDEEGSDGGSDDVDGGSDDGSGDGSDDGSGDDGSDDGSDGSLGSGDGSGDGTGNDTAGGSVGADTSGGSGGCDACMDGKVTVNLPTVRENLGQLGGEGSSPHCNGISCSRSRPSMVGPAAPGFPWLPLLITLTLAPLVGLLVARQAIKRWHIGKPTRKPSPVVQSGPKGPVDALDPMRTFLLDVKEWKSIPMPGAGPAPVVE